MAIKTKTITSKISVSERETHIYRSGDGWVMDSTVPKDFNAALRKGWTPVEQTVYDDGTVWDDSKGYPFRSYYKKERRSKRL